MKTSHSRLDGVATINIVNGNYKQLCGLITWSLCRDRIVACPALLNIILQISCSFLFLLHIVIGQLILGKKFLSILSYLNSYFRSRIRIRAKNLNESDHWCTTCIILLFSKTCKKTTDYGNAFSYNNSLILISILYLYSIF